MYKKTVVKKGVYYDSVKLMLVTREIKNMDGVNEVAVVMGTDLNKDSLERTGLITDEARNATATDMIVGVICDNEETISEIFDTLDNLLNSNESSSKKTVYKPKSVETAAKMQPGSNVCVISIPGNYAKDMAMEALRNNLHVMLFSDNVSLEDELELKQYALKKDLLVMGPDCGTAIINHVPLCFSNKINKGNIGIVAASGTGAQEVTTLIHKNGGGITQLIGTGGRDLKEKIGGITMMQGINALNEDENTKIITILSKPPAENIANKVISYIKENVKKPTVINFLGGDYSRYSEGNLYFVNTLEEAAIKSLQLSNAISDDFELISNRRLQELSELESKKVRKTGKYIKGLFSGGTLAYEAMFSLEDSIGEVSSNMSNENPVTDCFSLPKNSCVDLGDDVFTVGRAHPMIDSTLRAEIFKKELRNPETAVILMDIVLGYGANLTPERDFVKELEKYRNESKNSNDYVSIVASICGSKDDPQEYDSIVEALTSLGVIIMPSNLKATELSSQIIKLINK